MKEKQWQWFIFIYLFINWFIERHQVVTSEVSFLPRDGPKLSRYSLHQPGMARLSGLVAGLAWRCWQVQVAMMKQLYGVHSHLLWCSEHTIAVLSLVVPRLWNDLYCVGWDIKLYSLSLVVGEWLITRPQLNHLPSCFGAGVTNLNEPPSSFLPLFRARSWFPLFRAIVNKKQCETKGLFMPLVIHYWIGDIQDWQGVSASEMTCIVSGVALNSTHSLTHACHSLGPML